MTRISSAFDDCAGRVELALVAYLCAGYPSGSETVDLVTAAVEGGADVIELGVPFSDPLGDGPVIQECGRVALREGASVATALQAVEVLRDRGCTTPIALMGYYNPFLQYGLKPLATAAVAAGVDGFVVPDLPAHQADDLVTVASDADLDTIFFIAPGTRPERVRYTASRTSGFLYCLATNGVTGARENLNDQLTQLLDGLRASTDLPRAVGFGISHPDHVRALHGHAEGVIVGSALAQVLDQQATSAERCQALTDTVRDLKAATRR